MNTTSEIIWDSIILNLVIGYMKWDELEQAEQVELTEILMGYRQALLDSLKGAYFELKVNEYNKAYFAKPSILR